MEAITESHNWLKCRAPLITKCPAPINTPVAQSLYLSLREHCGMGWWWKDCKSWRSRKFAGRLCLQDTTGKICPQKSQHYSLLNKIWTMITSVGTSEWIGENSSCSIPRWRIIRNVWLLRGSKLIFSRDEAPTWLSRINLYMKLKFILCFLCT